MINKIKIFSIFKYLSPNLRLRIIFFGIFSILSSFLDIVSIGAIFPLLTSLMDTSYLTSNNLIKSFFNFFSLEISSQNIIQYTLITFIVFLVIATIVKVLLISFIIKTQNVITVFLSKVIFNGTIKQEYLYFSKLDTNKLTSVLTQKINSVSVTIQSILSSISSFISAFFIFIGLIFLNLKITLILGLVFLLFFLLIYFFIKKKVANNSEISSKTSDEVIKLIKETLGSIRYYILRDKIELISAVFENKFQKLKKIQIFLAKSNLIPKHLIEALFL